MNRLVLNVKATVQHVKTYLLLSILLDTLHVYSRGELSLSLSTLYLFIVLFVVVIPKGVVFAHLVCIATLIGGFDPHDDLAVSSFVYK